MAARVAFPRTLARPVRGVRFTAFRFAGRRWNSTTPPSADPKKSNTGLILTALVAAGGAGAYYFYTQQQSSSSLPTSGSKGPSKLAETAPKSKPGDYQAVYNAIAASLEEGAEDYDDGSFGPVVLRLAWHSSGTYDKESKTGGSNGATMRFAPESDHGANAGLKVARDHMERVKQQFPWITYGDLWTLGGVCAIQEMGGPLVPWRPGRADKELASCTPDGRLPDGAKEHSHLRDIFYRMGFNDQEIVALSGAHALGRCHSDRSGFKGPWTFSPTVMTNDYFKLLLSEKWQYKKLDEGKKWVGPVQFEDKATGTLMMLPADIALIKDKAFRKYTEIYAKDNDLFFKDFSVVVAKLFELGVPFKDNVKPFYLNKTENAAA